MARYAHVAGIDGQHLITMPADGKVIGQSIRYVSIKVQDADDNYIWGSSSSWSTWNPSSFSEDDPADDLTKTSFQKGWKIELRTDDSNAENSWISIEYDNGMRYVHVAPGDYFTAPSGGAKIIGRSTTAPNVRLNDPKKSGGYIWGSETTYDDFSTVADRPSSSLTEIALPGGSELRLSGASNTWLSIAY